MTTYSGITTNSQIRFFNQRIIDGIIMLFISYPTFYMSFLLGMDIAEMIKYIKEKYCIFNHDKKENTSNMNENQHKKSETKILFISLLISVILWCCFLFISIYVKSGRKYTLSALLGPFGTFIRYLLGKRNKKWKKFKMYTFIVNNVGTGISGVLIVLSNYFSDTKDSSDTLIIVLESIIVGFCGCLTTFSTFVLEIYLIESLKWKYIYCFLTILFSQILLFIINGIYVFGGFGELKVDTFR